MTIRNVTIAVELNLKTSRPYEEMSNVPNAAAISTAIPRIATLKRHLFRT